MGDRPWMKMSFMIPLLAAAAIASAAPQATTPSPSAGPALTFDQALALATANNQTIAAARLRRTVDMAGIDVARERPNPELRFEHSERRPHLLPDRHPALGSWAAHSRRIELAEAVARWAGTELALTLADVRSQVRRAYWPAGAAQARVGLMRDLGPRPSSGTPPASATERAASRGWRSSRPS